VPSVSLWMMLIGLVMVVSFDSFGWAKSRHRGGAFAGGVIPTASIVIATCLPTA